MVRTLRPRSERIALTTALPLGVAAVTLFVASHEARWSDPLFYIGLGTLGVALYLLASAFVRRLPLPAPHSERMTARFERRAEVALQQGQELLRRRVRTDEEMETWKQDYGAWLSATADWLRQDVSEADADALEHSLLPPQTGVTGGRFDDEHARLKASLGASVGLIRNLRLRGLS